MTFNPECFLITTPDVSTGTRWSRDSGFDQSEGGGLCGPGLMITCLFLANVSGSKRTIGGIYYDCLLWTYGCQSLFIIAAQGHHEMCAHSNTHTHKQPHIYHCYFGTGVHTSATSLAPKTHPPPRFIATDFILHYALL